MRHCRSRTGQSIIEGVAVLLITTAALLAMKGYIKRGLAGGYRNAANSIGDQYDPRGSAAKYNIVSRSDITSDSKLVKDKVIGQANGQDIKVNVMETTSRINEDSTTKTGEETIAPPKKGLWE